MRAYVLLTSKPGTSEEVLKMIKDTKKIKVVILADSVYGRFDAIIAVEAQDIGTLSKLIYEVIEKNQNITHTETLLTLFQ